jgi:hypothetical protein
MERGAAVEILVTGSAGFIGFHLARCLLPAACCLLPAACCLLPAACWPKAMPSPAPMP